ncbi:MAG: AraC family transcriptional regulator [Longimicrobiales bacterium]
MANASAAPLIPVMTGRSLASRTLPEFEISLVEHFGGVALPCHRHQEAVIALLLRGRYDESVAGRTVTPTRATVLVKPPETPHANEIGGEGTDTILIQLSPHNPLSAPLRADLNDTFVLTDSRVPRLGEMLLAELQRNDDVAAVSLESLVVELLAVLRRQDRRRGTGYSPRQAWLARAREYLHDQPAETFSLQQLATMLGVHRSHLARAFRMAFGCTIGEYLRFVRVQRLALQLESTDTPLARLAPELGFYDQSHLTRCFRQVYGVTPSDYRACRRNSRN